jgi:hypothetical protein
LHPPPPVHTPQKWITGAQKKLAADNDIKFPDDVQTCKEAKEYMDEHFAANGKGKYNQSPATEKQLALLEKMRARDRMPDRFPPSSITEASDMIKELIAKNDKATAKQLAKLKELGVKMTPEQIDSLTIKQAAALITTLFMNQRKKKGGGDKGKDE